MYITEQIHHRHICSDIGNTLTAAVINRLVGSYKPSIFIPCFYRFNSFSLKKIRNIFHKIFIESQKLTNLSIFLKVGIRVKYYSASVFLNLIYVGIFYSRRIGTGSHQKSFHIQIFPAVKPRFQKIWNHVAV